MAAVQIMSKTIESAQLQAGVFLYAVQASWRKKLSCGASRCRAGQFDADRVEQSGIQKAVTGIFHTACVEPGRKPVPVATGPADEPISVAPGTAVQPAMPNKPAPLRLDVEPGCAAQVCAPSDVAARAGAACLRRLRASGLCPSAADRPAGQRGNGRHSRGRGSGASAAG